MLQSSQFKPGHGKWNTANGYSPMTNFVLSIFPLSEGAIQHINEHCYAIKVAKGNHLLKEEEICHYLFFIQKGVMRGYLKDGNKEITTWFCAENAMVTAIWGFTSQQVSLENIQAVEDCELYAIHYDTLQYLYQHYVEVNVVGRILYERYYSDAERRAYICRIPMASKRYLYFIENYGEWLNILPLKYIASFLGMTIETLSRLRNKLSKSNA